MKNIALLWSIFLSIQVYAQTDCKNGVSTDFTNPTNNALPIVNSSQYLNGFDWFPIVGGIYDEYQTTNITFGGITIPEMNSIMTSAYMNYRYIWAGPLPLRENGWELLMVNLGRYPDDVTPITVGNVHYNKPYIVLYNRYSATIRVFVNYGLDHTVGGGANDMLIRLRFTDPYGDQNGNLRLYNGQDQALDDSTDITSITSVVLAPAEGQNWASADFKIAYDPCVCYHPSKLRLEFSQIAHTDIELHGRAITLTDEPLINGNLGSDLTEFLNGFDSNGNSTETGGVVMHKTLEKMISDYLEKYAAYNKKLVENKEHNAKVKQNLAILKMAKYVIATGQVVAGGISFPTQAVLATTASLSAAAESINLTDGDYKSEFFEVFEGNLFDISTDTIQRIDWFKAVEYSQKQIVKVESGVKKIDEKELFKAVKLIFGEKGETFIENNFELRSNGTAPTPPTATFTEMHYVGTLNDTLPISGVNFFTPGTYGSTSGPSSTGSPTIISPYEYPVYNDAMGVFALLKTPKIKISKTTKEIEEELFQKSMLLRHPLWYISTAKEYIRIQRTQTWTKEYQITLEEDLEYAFNDVLDIKDYDIEASFNITAKPVLIGGDPSTSRIHCYQDKNYNVNVESNTGNIDSYDGVVYRQKPYNYYSQNWYPWSLWDAVESDTTMPKDTLRYGGLGVDTSWTGQLPTIDLAPQSFQTPFLPINAFQQFTAGIGLKNEIISRSLNDRNRTFNSEQEIDDAGDSTNQNFCDPSYHGELPSFPSWDESCYSFNLFSPGVTRPYDANPLNSGYEYELTVQLKLSITVEFNTINSDGNNNKIDMMLTYDVPLVNPSSTSLVPNLASSSSNIGIKNLAFENTHFSGQNVVGCQLSGNNYTCSAWNKILIDGDISTANGYSVEFIAGNEIEVLPEADITPEAILRIEPILDYSHPMPKATQPEVTLFCQSENLYKANTPRHQLIQDPEKTNTEKNDESKLNDLDFTLYPNPTNTNIVSIQLIRGYETDSPIEITVHDVTGKLVQVQSQSTGAGMYTIDLSNIAPGTYFVTGSTYGNKVTKRLIVQ